ERAVAHLAPPLPGVVRRVMVQVGSRIEGGTPLLELDCPELREAQAAHMEASSALGLARASFERQEALQRSQAIPEREYQEARQAREAAELRLQAARDRLTLLGAPAAAAGGAEQAGTALGRLVLRSPLAGTVLALHTVAGETAAAEERLIVVADPQRLWVQADLYEQDLAMLLAEQQAHGSRLPASLEVRAYPLRTFPATLEMVGALLDPETRTVKLRLSVEGHDGLLRPGMYAQVRLPLGGGEPVLAVPESAVLEDEGRFFVFRREQDRYFLRRPVEPGRVRAGWVEIRAGLDGRETVVADGAFLLKSEVLRAKMGAGCAD
ncbi:MAG: efflux RND transporter periplasmic adaptor subunit, partial [Deltaproteobacteria bacterium]|nr:efflux RND transporter periplasmic adaptor subunit [Deltaproteobacteria bacterium]